MFMARSSERLSADAYTRASVEEYLRAAAEQRARIELAIAEAEQRRDRAVEVKDWLDRLGQRQQGPVRDGAPAPEPADAESGDA